MKYGAYMAAVEAGEPVVAAATRAIARQRRYAADPFWRKVRAAVGLTVHRDHSAVVALLAAYDEHNPVGAVVSPLFPDDLLVKYGKWSPDRGGELNGPELDAFERWATALVAGAHELERLAEERERDGALSALVHDADPRREIVRTRVSRDEEYLALCAVDVDVVVPRERVEMPHIEEKSRRDWAGGSKRVRDKLASARKRADRALEGS